MFAAVEQAEPLESDINIILTKFGLVDLLHRHGRNLLNSSLHEKWHWFLLQLDLLLRINPGPMLLLQNPISILCLLHSGLQSAGIHSWRWLCFRCRGWSRGSSSSRYRSGPTVQLGRREEEPLNWGGWGHCWWKGVARCVVDDILERFCRRRMVAFWRCLRASITFHNWYQAFTFLLYMAIPILPPRNSAAGV